MFIVLEQPGKSSTNTDKESSPHLVAALVGLWEREAVCPRLWSSSLEKTDSDK